jgi:acyl-CoA thioester hydrolase
MRDTLLKGFSVIVDWQVAWSDMDALRHVNNVTYFRYFENVRIAYFERIKLWEIMEKTGIGPIISSTQCRFRIPLTYPDVVSIGSCVSDISQDGFTMKLCVASHRLSKIAAEGEALLVSFDYRNNRRVPMPTQLKQNILDLEEAGRQKLQ